VEFLSEDSRNLLRGEGGNVNLGARTLKHIIVFVFAIPLSIVLLFISCIAFIAHLNIHVWYCAYTCINPRELL